MKKIKLPRKRKKAIIKAIGRGDYQLMILVNEVICEEKPAKKNTTFPNKLMDRRKKIYSNW